MRILLRLILVAALAAVVWWSVTALFPSPQTAIRRRLNQIAQLASFPPDEGNIAKTLNVNKIGGFLAEKIEVRLAGPGGEEHTFNNRDELLQAVMLARTNVRGAKARFLDPGIEISPGGQSATIDVTLRADVGDEKDAIIEELRLNMKKIQGDWVISKVEPVKTLK